MYFTLLPGCMALAGTKNTNLMFFYENVLINTNGVEQSRRNQVKKTGLRMVIICLCVIFFVSTLNSFKTRFPAGWYNKERFASLLKAVDFMKVNNDYRYLGAGQWISWELEYLLPGVNNFKKLTAQEEKKRKYRGDSGCVLSSGGIRRSV